MARENGQGWHNDTRVRTIALEEHFWTPELAAPPGTGLLAVWGQRVDDQLRDLGQARLADMDASGIDFQVISHVAPAAQELNGAERIARAREANERLAAAVRAHPDRFAGFAALPTADPQAAAGELERAVKDLGLIGALVNSALGSNGASWTTPGSPRCSTASSGWTCPSTCIPPRHRKPSRTPCTRACPRSWRAGWPPAPGAGTPKPAGPHRAEAGRIAQG